MDELVLEEVERLESILKESCVDDKKIRIMRTLIQNTALMKVKLDETSEIVKGSSVVIKYDNGGGQTGIRENPIFKGYESLFKSYMQGMQKIMDAIPEQYAETRQAEMEKPRTMLEVVRARKQA